MYQIGLFSKINRITAKTLRHYDAIGLLKPGYVDPHTGYRYYTSKELIRMNRILALKQLGLTLEEIARVIGEPEMVKLILTLKRQELRERIKEEEGRLRQVEVYLKNIEGETNMDYNPILKRLPGCTVASMRTVADNYNAYFTLIPPMGEEMRRQGAVCADPPYCFTIYHDGEYKESDIDIEVCEAVQAPREDSDLVRYKRMAPVPEAACVLHRGSYAGLREAYLFLYRWIDDNGYEPADNPRESYIDGIWNKEREEEWLTELQVPVKVLGGQLRP